MGVWRVILFHIYTTGYYLVTAALMYFSVLHFSIENFVENLEIPYLYRLKVRHDVQSNRLWHDDLSNQILTRSRKLSFTAILTLCEAFNCPCMVACRLRVIIRSLLQSMT